MASAEAKIEADQPEETLIWSKHVRALRAAIEARKPDALDRVKLEVAKKETEISALANRRELMAQTAMRDEARALEQIDRLEDQINRAQEALPKRMGQIDRQIARLNKQMGDLEKLTRGLRKTMLDNDTGQNPEAEMHERDKSLAGMSSDQCRAAEDIRIGYLVRAGRGFDISARYEEPMPGGRDEIGKRRNILDERYGEYVQEMHRQRRAMCWVIDVVCENMTAWDSAQRRRVAPAKVLETLAEDLQLYADRFPPLDHKSV